MRTANGATRVRIDLGEILGLRDVPDPDKFPQNRNEPVEQHILTQSANV